MILGYRWLLLLHSVLNMKLITDKSVVVKAIQPLLDTWYIQISAHITITISIILKYEKKLLWYCKTICILCKLIEMKLCDLTKKRGKLKIHKHFYYTKENMKLCTTVYRNLDRIQ